MAEATLPRSAPGRSWLDRPAFPTWQRAAALLTHWEILAYGAIVLLAFVLRVWGVGDRAMHHDESLHAYYAWQFFVGKGYSYDPLMHGPFQFEVVPIFYLLFGASEFSARLLAVLLGTALVGLPYFLRSYLTRPGAWLTSIMLAISPGMVYFSRFIRDDIYLACFSLILFVCLVRFLENHRARYLYVGAAALALGIASMEAAYLTTFVFGSFLLAEAFREMLVDRNGPVLRAVRATSLDTWLTTVSIFVVLIVLLFSTFFTNPYGIWDTQHSLLISNCKGFVSCLNPARKDILGGLFYWRAQHEFQRGGQPWFYYLLILPLYEQLALLFGAAGIVFACIRRSFVGTFLVWWAVMTFGLYSWAGEKMPWLSIHITLPLILLAGLFLGSALSWRRLWKVIGVGAMFVLLFALEVHSTFLLNFRDAADPTEMLIYVQTAQDVPNVTREIGAIAARHGGQSMPIGLDSTDVGGWPFTWYLRDYSNVTESTTFSGPACGGQYCPVLLLLGPEYDQYSSQLSQHYVAQRYRWNWWFPEDYKQWFPQHWGDALQGKAPLSTILGTSQDWSHIWDWLMYRRPFGDRGARLMYFLVRRDLVPGAHYFKGPATSGAATSVSSLPSVPATLKQTIGAAGALGGQLNGPRGVAVGSRGEIYVADTLNHRIAAFTAAGKPLVDWGNVGAGPSQFSSNNSPLGVAVGPNGDIYVADTWNQRIQVFSPPSQALTGAFLRQWGGGPIGAGPGQFYGPRSLAVSQTGRVYVADTGNKRIQVFNTHGKYLFSWGTAGSGPGQFQEPSSVALGSGGRVYVADFWNQRIQEFSATGSFIRSWPVNSWVPQSYDEPYLAVDQHTGDVLASDPRQKRVLVFSGSGHLLGAFGGSQLTLPVGVAVTPSGQVVVGDATTSRVQVFSLGAPRTQTHRGRVPRAKKP